MASSLPAMGATSTDSTSSPWRFVWAFLVGLLATALFFRSVLPRLPRILFRGKLRIRRAGIRGIRGIEYRSKGFHNDSAAFSRHEDQLELKVQRIYASYHLPYFLCRAQDQPSVVPRKSSAIITIHVQGVGVRIPRSSHHKHHHKHAQQPPKHREHATSPAHSPAALSWEQQEELRLQRLMSSPSLSPTAEAPASLHLLPSPTHASAHLDHQLHPPAPPPGSGLYLTFHRAGLMSLHSVLSLASWFRTSVIPRITSLVLRAFRAALYLLTSSIPVLTSLVSVEIDRIEVYVQEAEAVARIGRAGLTFSMSPGSATDADRSKSASNENAAADRASPSTFFDAMRMMPTRMGSGARGVASYLVAGMSPSSVKAHIRVDSIELFEANFKPSAKSNPNSRVSSRRNSDAASSRSPARATSPSYAESGPFSPSQSDAAMDTTQDDPSLPIDDSIDSGYRQRGPPRRRSNSASRLSRMSSTSLRGFADRWADWALEPLVDSDFHADSGWTRKHLSDDFPSDKLQTIPTSARILSINGVTELTASILMGSNLALGGDKTLSAKLALGAAVLRLDAAHRALRVVDGRKSHETNFANAPGGGQKGTHPPHPRHPRPPGMRHSSPAATALHMISSLSLSLPSVRVMASSETMLLATAPHTEEMGQDSNAASSPPARQFALNLAGFSFDLKHSDPRDTIHRRWLGTCGLAKKKSAGRPNRSKKTSANDKSADQKHNLAASPFGSVAIDHRRVFLVDISLASLEVHCREHARSQGSRLLFVGDLSVESRSSWTPFGLLASCPESARMLLSGDPNEHVAAVETSVGGVESNVTLEDITALIQIANEVNRQRQAMRSASASDKPRRPRAGGRGVPRLPRIAAGLHIKRISLVLDASCRSQAEKRTPRFSKDDGPCSRQLILSVPNIDFMFFGEYRDEYVKRPIAEKRAAYKALKADTLEWPISGKEMCKAVGKAKKEPMRSPQVSVATLTAEPEAVTPGLSEPEQQRYNETNLTMEETLRRMQELQQHKPSRADKAPATARRPSIRDAMSKTGKVRLPGYTRKSSMAAETRFNLRYQFETCLAVDAVELFLSLNSAASSAKGRFVRPASATTQSSPSRGTSQHHLLAMHSFEVHGLGRVPGNAEPRGSALCDEQISLSAADAVAEFRANIEDVDIEAWQPRALDTYADIAATIVRAKQESTMAGREGQTDGVASDAMRNHPKSVHEPKPLVERLPGGLALYISIGRTIAHLGGPDHRIEDDVARGVGFEAERIVLEYAAVTETKTNASTLKTNWGARTALELSEDLQLQAVSLATRHGRVGLARVVLHEAGFFPILDASLATRQHTEGTASEPFARAKAQAGRAAKKASEGETLERPATSLLAEGIWNFDKSDERVHQSTQHRPRFRQQDRSNFILFLPYAAVKAVVRPPHAENKAGLAGTSEDEVFVTTENTNLLAFKIDILHTYCILLALATFKDLAQSARRPDVGLGTTKQEGTSAHTPVRHHRPSFSCRFDIKEVHTFVTLPRAVQIFIRVRRLEVRSNPQDGLAVSIETAMGAVESPKQIKGDAWEEAVRLRDWKVMLPPKRSEGKVQIKVNGDAALIRIPYGYAVNPIIDNTSVAIKATKQIVHQFLKSRDDSIITPYAEEPKLLPDIDINIRVLTLEAQDDPFETKLNLIWRAGLAENSARDERESAFAAKAEELGATKMPHSSTSFRSGRSNVSLGSSIASADSDSEDASSFTSHDTRFTASKQQHVSYEEARMALDAFNSSSWVRRYTNARSEQIRRQEAVLKNIYGRFPLSRSHDELPINVLPIGKAAPLVRSTMYRVGLKVGQAHFPIDQLRDFIHEKGAGIPKDTPFSLLVPLHIKWEMEEWRVTLRDYPMPLLHVPPTHRSESDARKAWCFEGDIVIAEQLGGPESIRHVPAVIVPAATGRPDAVEYGIVIPKVAMPVKTYGTPTVRLRTPFPTRLVWGQSIQPTIQDVMRVIDGITPPPHDPSPKLGFWDKLPLILHGHLNIKLEDEGGFNIHLKGGRDPYGIQGQDAGWVKSWKGGVEIRIGYDNPQKEVFQILSHEYVLAVPDLTDYVDHAATGILGGDQHGNSQQSSRDGEESYHDSYDRKSLGASFTSSMHRYMKDPTFRKIVIKLTNGVRWGAGLHGERTCDDETCPRRPKCKGEPFYRECRIFERIDHWKVVTKTREHFDSLPEDERRDSYRGWRSHHLHFSLSVFSPKNGISSYGGQQKHASRLDAVNNFYFTPLAWAHFWAWMRLFNSAMSLPIRTGQLFPESPPPSPKFGRFLGTIKYRIDLEPLFITHQYRQFNKEDWARGLRTHVGIKARINAFTLDMHQRQQEMVKERPELGEPRIVFHKPFYEAEVSCESIDLKTFAAQMRDDCEIPSVMDEQEVGESIFDDLFAQDVPISDDELEWVDMNDLVELDSQAIKDPSPKIRMYPAMVCPQFNYYRKVDSKRERRAKETQKRAANGKRSREQGADLEELLSKLERSKFGSEKSHVCMVGQNDKPYGIQRKIAQDRLKTIRSEIDRVLNSSDDGSAESQSHSEGVDDQQERLNELHGRERILSGFIAHLGRLQEDTDRIERAKAEGIPAPKRSGTIDRNFTLNATDLASLYRDLGMFDNRYIAHNPTLFFSNTTRTLLLKYYYSSRMRRGYAHHMTATAVRYIRELLKKKDKAGRPSATKMNDYLDAGRSTQHLTPSTEGANGLDILHEMLDDMINHMRGKDGYSKSGWGTRNEGEEDEGLEAGMRPTDGISDDFNVAKSNVCVLLKPQIVLRSDVDDNSTVIVSALRTRLQNYTVQDESCAEDSVNATVLRRNFFALDSLQCWHPNARSKSTYLVEARADRHGFVALPLEALVDMHGQCRDFERIVPHTNASMYYDKFNKLRLSDSSRSVSTFRKDGKPVQDHLHHHMDMILLNCPRFSVSANSEHFAALYNVVTDLILYRDPAHRDHAKRLEEMMFSYDFTDVSGLADIVTALQVRIREAQALIEQYRAVADRLNERGRTEYVAVLRDVLELVTELNLIMEAITTSQDSKGGADREKKSALRFMTQAQEVAWNMIGDEAGELVTKLALRGISFSWLNKADNSAANTLAIQDLQALSVDPDAMFAEIIAKYLRAPDHPMAKEGRFLDAMWSVLPPVGGISIVDMFEFNLHPVKIQIELVVGRKIMDYIFGTKRQREKQEEEQKRLEDQTRRQEKAIAKKKSPLARLLGGRKNLTGSASSQTSRRPSTNASSRNASTVDLASRNASSTDLLSVGRPSSDGSREDDADSVSGRTRVATGGISTGTAKASLKSRPGTPASGRDAGSDDERRGDQFAIAQRNAAEMRSRASAYRTFVYVKISQTIFCLSYKGEKEKSITDLYDLVFRTPNFEYHNSTFGYVDLADTFKKDVFKAAWNQKSTLLRDIITHRPNRKRNAIESIRAIRQASKARESLAPLDIAVEPPTPAGRSSFDGSSHLVESPTDTFSYRGGEAYGDDGQSIDSQALEADDDGDGSRSEEGLQRPEHVRQGTGQTLAGQIRDEWGRNNELEAAAQASTPSLASSDERRDSVGEVDAMLHLHTPRRESADPEPSRRFPGLRRLSFGGDSPATERGEALSMASAGSSPYLQLPPGAASRRASLASNRSHSPSFKLNKLLPRSLRRGASTSAPGRNGTSPADEEQHMQRATSSDYSASIRSTH
ncbi:uncharacterized protein PAN0_008c3637 [Moesziomyces antarcticus]|uniref:Uncharacterized protein n=2 Tax=Pseudozyma antarctica TaxID=84753 RepID=A0A5C3FSV7_PSEA2|nr:uncharacterized protein PAN0_008c3637 [Moesziomyces antarcticus]GAK65420.1 conserved hypothetical protein [Moesziomyces antarcticus]SPO46429.1 uncharacterized protein PSANT_04115 [Moesziomyces antarcticus]